MSRGALGLLAVAVIGWFWYYRHAMPLVGHQEITWINVGTGETVRSVASPGALDEWRPAMFAV